MRKEYNGYFLTQEKDGTYTIQFETGGIFFEGVTDLKRCFFLIDNYYYSSIDGSLKKKNNKIVDYLF